MIIFGSGDLVKTSKEKRKVLSRLNKHDRICLNGSYGTKKTVAFQLKHLKMQKQSHMQLKFGCICNNEWSHVCKLLANLCSHFIVTNVNISLSNVFFLCMQICKQLFDHIMKNIHICDHKPNCVYISNR